MNNKHFMKSLRLTQEPRFLSPFEQRLIRYHERDQRELWSALRMMVAIVGSIFIVSLIVQ